MQWHLDLLIQLYTESITVVILELLPIVLLSAAVAGVLALSSVGSEALGRQLPFAPLAILLECWQEPINYPLLVPFSQF